MSVACPSTSVHEGKTFFSDGELLPVTTREPYMWESAFGEPDCLRGPKGTTSDFSGSSLNTSGLNQDLALTAFSTSTSDGEQTIWDNLAAGYAQDVYPQVLPDPPSYVSLLPSDCTNESTMAVVKDETQQTHGTKYTWPHVLVMVGGYAQGFHLMKIPCATKSMTLSFGVNGMMTSFLFDRGKIVASLPFLPLCSLIANPIKALSSKPGASAPTSIKSIGRLFPHVTPYCLWGATAYICSILHKSLATTVNTCTLTLPGYGLPMNPTSKFPQAQAKWLAHSLSLA